MVRFNLLVLLCTSLTLSYAQSPFINIGNVDSVWRYYPADVIQKNDSSFEVISTYRSAQVADPEELYLIDVDQKGKYSGKSLLLLDSLCYSPSIIEATHNTKNELIISGFMEGCSQGFIIKVDNNRKQKWFRRTGIASNLCVSKNDALAFSTSERLYKVDQNGKLIWEGPLRNKSTPSVGALLELSDSGYLATNYFPGSRCNFTRFSKSGEILWTRSPNDTDLIQFSSLWLTKDNHIISVGIKPIVDSSILNYRIFLIKMDTALNIIWQYATPYHGNYKAGIIELLNGNYLMTLASVSKNNSIGASFITCSSSGQLLKDTFVGRKELAPIHDFPLFEIYLSSVQITKDRGMLACMSVGNYNVGRTYCLIKTDSNGQIVLPRTSGISNPKIYSAAPRIYPNPCIGCILHLDFSTEVLNTKDDIQISLINTLGQEVLFKKGQANMLTELELDSLAKGVYFIRIGNSDLQQLMQKLIIQ